MMQVWADYLDKLRTNELVLKLEPKELTDVRLIQVAGYQ